MLADFIAFPSAKARIGIQPYVKHAVIHDLTEANRAGKGCWEAQGDYVGVVVELVEILHEEKHAECEVDYCEDIEQADCIGSMLIKLYSIVDSEGDFTCKNTNRDTLDNDSAHAHFNALKLVEPLRFIM